MLVYSNHLPVRSAEGLVTPLGPVAEWLSSKLRRRISAEALLRGGDIHQKDGWQVRSLVAVDQYPHLVSVELAHPDRTVSGRRWHSEIGLHHKSASADIDLTVLVQTREVSARVVSPVVPGAPTFVSDILRRCQISSAAIGGSIRTLDDDDAEAFRYVVLDSDRNYPLVVVSPTREGGYGVETDLLSQFLIGIAELVVIPPTSDTFWLARSVGREYVPYLGAIKIIFPSGSMGHLTVRTLTREDLAAAGLNSRDAARELFSLVLHRTNVPLSWRHVGPARVREEILRRELERRRATAAATGNAVEYLQFLEEYVKEQEAATQQAVAEKKGLEEALESAQRIADETQRDLRAKSDALKLQLESASDASDDSPYAPEDVPAIADTVASAIKRDLTPEECLKLVEHLFTGRVVILPEAWTSAREARGFKYGPRLYALLHALGTSYWTALKDGTPDQEARAIFGNAYAAKESEGVAANKEAKRRRTFRFAGEDHIMVKHLKIGVKDSAAESIRVHFEWFADRQRIVIGHCGPHLPFN